MRRSGSIARPAWRRAAILLPLALSTTGCLLSSEKPVVVTRHPPAELVQPCPDQPPRPAAFGDEAERYSWALKAIHAGAICRAKHEKLVRWAIEPPT